MVVELDEPVVGGSAFAAGISGSGVGPFLERDPVESFDVTVGLGSVGPGLLEGGPGCRPGTASPVLAALSSGPLVGFRP